MKLVITFLIKLWGLIKTWQKYLIAISLLIAAGFFLGRYTTQIKTITIQDSVFVPTFITEIDTIKIKPNIDSLFNVAKKYWLDKPLPVKVKIIKGDTVYIKQNINYVAKLDTIYSQGHLRLSLAFVSPIPLHPKSYFRINAIAEYTEPVIPKSWLNNRFIIYTGVGISSNHLLTPTFQIGFGVRIY